MKTIVIYGSQYGTAERYAKELARRIDSDVTAYEGVKNIDDYETVIYIGALYAGGVLGMKKTFSKLKDTDKKIIIATVGVTDPADQEYTGTVKEGIRQQLSEEISNKAKIFHLRGGIDYSRLSFMHKTMLKMLYKKAAELPEEKRTADIRAIVETYNQKADFVDFDSLKQIIREIQ